nr:MAG TPA: hypothetical protein [Caudoviricetes sp.]
MNFCSLFAKHCELFKIVHLFFTNSLDQLCSILNFFSFCFLIPH